MEVQTFATRLNLHFRHSSVPLEMFNGVWDIWWGLWVVVFNITAIQSVEFGYLSAIVTSSLWVGIPAIFIGLTQLLAICKGSRELRKNLALMSVVVWLGLLSLVLSIHGADAAPYVMNYGLAAIGEAWVFLRLTRPWV